MLLCTGGDERNPEAHNSVSDFEIRLGKVKYTITGITDSSFDDESTN